MDTETMTTKTHLRDSRTSSFFRWHQRDKFLSLGPMLLQSTSRKCTQTRESMSSFSLSLVVVDAIYYRCLAVPLGYLTLLFIWCNFSFFVLLHQASQMRTYTCKTVPNHKLITPANVSVSKKGRKYVDPNLALEDVYQMCNRMRPV